MGKDYFRSVNAKISKKRVKGGATTRPMTTTLFVLRALELGIRKQDLRFYSAGQIFALLTEKSNDKVDWPKLATQDDINALFPH